MEGYRVISFRVDLFKYSAFVVQALVVLVSRDIFGYLVQSVTRANGKHSLKKTIC